ncbi:MAG: ATP-dependent helicase RecG [Bacteroidota bacterium]
MQQPIEYLNGVSAVRGDLFRKELSIFNIQDLLEHYPLRHLDKTKIDEILQLNPNQEYAQIVGKITSIQMAGDKRTKRLIAQLKDQSGTIELVWFQGISWAEKMLQVGQAYLVFGRLAFFMGKPQIAHPEMEVFHPEMTAGKAKMEPVYPTTEKLKSRGLNGKAIGKITEDLFRKVNPSDLPENLPESLLNKFKLMPRFQAMYQIHFPGSEALHKQAIRRIKFEELFFAQYTVQSLRAGRHRFSRGRTFQRVGELFNQFYEHHLPFSLTGAQKKVLKEIRKDMGSGHQMNRLLQGDVGSGKTMVALLSMLIAADNGFQSVLMAPTEILAQQHFHTIKELLKDMPVNLALLTGSTPSKARKQILASCIQEEIHILIGTHAIIEDQVQFGKLGFAVVDEQHKFGVAQRAKLWSKSEIPPHVLVMTATPIPRTLALTAYGDLDYSIIDELPPGRKPIATYHKMEQARPQVMDFIRKEIELGRQAYIIYPLIEESSKLDYENLYKGYEEVKSFFPEPKFWISMVHGKQPTDQKESNMKKFVSGDTQIMVSTTVIEVGVNVPNASVMVIESAEKFGLSQLHQLRGRVGRGSEKSYCILLTGNKLSRDARERLQIMTETNDGFKIAEKDLEIRGPGDMEGTRQSGAILFKLANIVDDKVMLEAARDAVTAILEDDFELLKPENVCIKSHLHQRKSKTGWSKIS